MDKSSDIAMQLREAEGKIIHITTKINNFKQTLRRFDSGLVSGSDLNEKYHELIMNTKDMTNNLSICRNASSADPALRVKANKLTEKVIDQIKEVQSLGTKIQQTSKGGDFKPHYSGKPSAYSDLVDDAYHPQKQIQSQMGPIEQEADQRTAQEMEQLENDLVQLNELFTSVAAYVYDQDAVIESISDHIEGAYAKVELGTDQLKVATSHRQAVRRKKCCCAIIGLVVLIIIIIIIAVSVK